jgi:putative molybdopterin biosynthesis protein
MPRSRLRNDVQPEFYTVGQLAELLQLTPMTIYRMVRRGELPCHAIGRIKRFRRGDVEAFLQKSRRPAVG